jgi:hypothetical protein
MGRFSARVDGLQSVRNCASQYAQRVGYDEHWT